VALAMWSPLVATAAAQASDPPESTSTVTPPATVTATPIVTVPATDAKPAKQEEKPDTWRFGWEEHPTLHLGPKAQVQFRARLQADVRESEAPIGSADSFDVSRRRIGLEGGYDGLFDFQIEREIDGDDPWRDVYINYRQFDLVQGQGGKFKLPFSLDENTSSTNLDFVYRSRLATQLAPGRDRGVMVHGRALKRMLGYEAGLFAHDGDNARTRNEDLVFGDRTFAGRITVQPLRTHKSIMRDLQVGVAMTASDVPEGMPALRGRTALDESFFSSRLWVQGSRRRTGLELRWRPGPASVKAEYARVSTERREQSVDDTDLSNLVATAWYVSGTYLVTGERKAAGADAPRRPVFRGGYGAVEVAGRIERLSFGSVATGDPPSLSPRADVVFGNADRVLTVGVNWYPIRGVKVQGNIVSETIADPSRGPLPVKSRYWSQLLRVQLTI
jgi:phosphate-selective porin OprO/OprP